MACRTCYHAGHVRVIASAALLLRRVCADTRQTQTPAASVYRLMLSQNKGFTDTLPDGETSPQRQVRPRTWHHRCLSFFLLHSVTGWSFSLALSDTIPERASGKRGIAPHNPHLLQCADKV